MVKVSIRVRSGVARFDVAVVAESVEQAISLVRGRYLTSEVRPMSLSVDDLAARTRAESFLPTDAVAA